mgnify:CR=1 FL=1
MYRYPFACALFVTRIASFWGRGDRAAETASTPVAEAASEKPEPTGPAEEEVVEQRWGLVCRVDSDCDAPTKFCLKQPRDLEGYCSIQCTSAQVCNDAGAPVDSWICNGGNGDVLAMTWFGSQTEIAQ